MTDLTTQVADYIVTRRIVDWSTAAIDKVGIHVYDTLVAMMSGRHLIAGRKAMEYVTAFGEGHGTSRIVGSAKSCSPEIAAMVNGMLAHADETDDTSETARMHPGASIVPAALALADHLESNGDEFLNAVLTGYQVGIAFPKAIWVNGADRMHTARASHNAGQVMGAVAAAGVLLNLDTTAMRFALSYASQLSSGVNSLYREKSHVEKAYVFGGMPAEQGVRAALFASLGFTGVPDILDRSINFFDSFKTVSAPEKLMSFISHPEGGVFEADIKLYPVGLPIQAAAQAMDEILAAGRIEAAAVTRITCHLPSQKAYIVDNRDMPPICLQYILATMIEDHGLTFANSHDQTRLDRSREAGLMSRVVLVHDEDMNPDGEGGSRNKAFVSLELSDGATIHRRVDELKGTRFQIATWDDMARKTQVVLSEDDRLVTQYLAAEVRKLSSCNFGQRETALSSIFR